MRILGERLRIEREHDAMSNTVDAERMEHGRRLLLADDAYADLVEIFRVLVDPSRLKILHSLLDHEYCTCELAAITGASESVVSQHLRVLRQLRLVTSRRSGRRVFYQLQDTRLRSLLAVSLDHADQAAHADGAPQRSRVLARLTTDVHSL